MAFEIASSLMLIPSLIGLIVVNRETEPTDMVVYSVAPNIFIGEAYNYKNKSGVQTFLIDYDIMHLTATKFSTLKEYIELNRQSGSTRLKAKFDRWNSTLYIPVTDKTTIYDAEVGVETIDFIINYKQNYMVASFEGYLNVSSGCLKTSSFDMPYRGRWRWNGVSNRLIHILYTKDLASSDVEELVKYGSLLYKEGLNVHTYDSTISLSKVEKFQSTTSFSNPEPVYNVGLVTLPKTENRVVQGQFCPGGGINLGFVTVGGSYCPDSGGGNYDDLKTKVDDNMEKLEKELAKERKDNSKVYDQLADKVKEQEERMAAYKEQMANLTNATELWRKGVVHVLDDLEAELTASNKNPLPVSVAIAEKNLGIDSYFEVTSYWYQGGGGSCSIPKSGRQAYINNKLAGTTTQMNDKRILNYLNSELANLAKQQNNATNDIVNFMNGSIYVENGTIHISNKTDEQNKAFMERLNKIVQEEFDELIDDLSKKRKRSYHIDWILVISCILALAVQIVGLMIAPEAKFLVILVGNTILYLGVLIDAIIGVVLSIMDWI